MWDYEGVGAQIVEELTFSIFLFVKQLWFSCELRHLCVIINPHRLLMIKTCPHLERAFQQLTAIGSQDTKYRYRLQIWANNILIEIKTKILHSSSFCLWKKKWLKPPRSALSPFTNKINSKHSCTYQRL